MKGHKRREEACEQKHKRKQSARELFTNARKQTNK